MTEGPRRALRPGSLSAPRRAAIQGRGGEFVGAYTCPGSDCDRIFDLTPPT